MNVIEDINFDNINKHAVLNSNSNLNTLKIKLS